MIDRFGRRIQVGWLAWEVEYLLAAITLPKRERRAAFEDIASMTGRKFAAIQFQAHKYAVAAEAVARRERLGGDSAPPPVPPAVLPPSQLNTSARMMALRCGARA